MMSSIKYPGKHDVMLGRGGESNYHSGNIAFRHMVQKHKERFRLGSRKEKNKIIDEVVSEWRNQEPNGRFVAKKKLSNGEVIWYDVGDDVAKKRAAKSLAEWIPPASQADSLKRQTSESSHGSQGSAGGKKRSRPPLNAEPPSITSGGQLEGVVRFNRPPMGPPFDIADVARLPPRQLSSYPQLAPIGLPQPPSSAPQPDRDLLPSAAIGPRPHVAAAPRPPAAAERPPPQQAHGASNNVGNRNVQQSNVNTGPGTNVKPIEDIRLHLPTAADLVSSAFADEEKSSSSYHQSGMGGLLNNSSSSSESSASWNVRFL